MRLNFLDWFQSRQPRNPQRTARREQPQRTFRLRRARFEVLEDRRVLANYNPLASAVDGATDSLRAAIIDANSTAEDDVITLSAGTYTLTVANSAGSEDASAEGDLDVTQVGFSITIIGAGAGDTTIQAGDLSDLSDSVDRVFDVLADASLKLEGVTIQHGNVADVITGGGGGIRNFLGHVELTSSIVAHNQAGYGGGIHTQGAGGPVGPGTLLLTDSTISDNTASAAGGGIYSFADHVELTRSHVLRNHADGQGGGIYTQAAINVPSNQTLIVEDSTISGNTADGNGGGIYNYNDHVEVTRSLVANNIAAAGGGIYTVAAAAATTLLVADSTIDGNEASAGAGGGIYNQGDHVEVTDSTVSNNTANGDGGGIFTTSGLDTLVVTNSTISGNTSGDDGGGIAVAFDSAYIFNSTITLNTAADTGGGVFATNSIVQVGSSIIAGNTNNGDSDSPDAGGVFTDLGFNLIGDATGATGFTTSTLVGTSGSAIEPELLPLNFNGGLTRTHALKATSLALDAGADMSAETEGTLLANDQRGAPFARNVDGPDGGTVAAYDIGAYEYQALGFGLIVDTLVDENDGDYSLFDLSLREAIGLAEGNPGPDTITFHPIMTATGDGVISLTIFDTGLDPDEFGPSAFRVTTDITIQGPTGANGIIVERAEANTDKFRLFYVYNSDTPADAKLTIENLTLRGGLAQGGNGFDGGGGAAGMGGAIFSRFGEVTLTNSTLANNEAVGGNGSELLSGGGGGGVGQSATSNGNGGGPNGGVGASGGFGGGGASGGGESGFGGGFGGGGGAGSFGGSGGFGGGGGAGTISGGAGGFGGGSGVFGEIIGAGGGGGAGMGGAVFNYHGTLDITNSTLSGNEVVGGEAGLPGTGLGFSLGGAVFNYNGELTVLNSTLTGRDGAGTAETTIPRAEKDGVIFSVGDSIGPDEAEGTTATVTLNNSILANTEGGADFAHTTVGTGTSNASAGTGNLIENNIPISTVPVYLPYTGGVASTGVDPDLGALADNGGPTYTHALSGTSPARNAGNNAAASSLEFDQRGAGFDRLIQGTVDIGAFEIQGTLLAALDGSGNLTVTDIDPVGKNNVFTVSIEGTNLVISDANEQFLPLPAAVITAGGVLSNGNKTLTIPLAAVTGSATVFGEGGTNSAKLIGTSDYDVLVLFPFFGTLDGSNYLIHVEDIQAITGQGGGSDEAYLYDSSGNDIYVSLLTSSLMTNVAVSYLNLANGFLRVLGVASDGADEGYLYGGGADDTFVGRSASSVLIAGSQDNHAIGFDTVTGVGGGGTGDAAYLFGTADAEVFAGFASNNYLFSANYFLRAVNFDSTTAISGGGTNDQAYLHTSAGADTFAGTETYSLLDGVAGFMQAWGFDAVVGVGDGDVNDVAHLFDTAGNDFFIGAKGNSYLSGGVGYNQVNDFRTVHGYASDGIDDSYFYDSAGDDAFVGAGNEAHLSSTDYDLFGHSFTAGDFVRAVRTNAGTDTIVLNAVDYIFQEIGDWEGP